MTKLEFILECNELLIDPAIALENEQVVEALKNRDDDEVKRLLMEEF